MWCSKNNSRIAHVAICVSTLASLGLVDKGKNQVSYYFYQTLRQQQCLDSVTFSWPWPGFGGPTPHHGMHKDDFHNTSVLCCITQVHHVVCRTRMRSMFCLLGWVFHVFVRLTRSASARWSCPLEEVFTLLWGCTLRGRRSSSTWTRTGWMRSPCWWLLTIVKTTGSACMTSDYVDRWAWTYITIMYTYVLWNHTVAMACISCLLFVQRHSEGWVTAVQKVHFGGFISSVG